MDDFAVIILKKKKPFFLLSMLKIKILKWKAKKINQITLPKWIIISFYCIWTFIIIYNPIKKKIINLKVSMNISRFHDREKKTTMTYSTFLSLVVVYWLDNFFGRNLKKRTKFYFFACTLNEHITTYAHIYKQKKITFFFNSKCD
jgi:hypothetical protein